MLPDEQRISYVRGDRWIGYTIARAALQRLEELFAWPIKQRMPNLLIVGPTINGKSKIIEKFRRQHHGEGGRVHCLALGGVDLTSPAGKVTMQVMAAVAEFERDLLIERTQSGIIRAKAAGKQFGRPPALDVEECSVVLKRLGAGATIAEIAREFKTTRQTIMRVREAALNHNKVNDS